MVDFDVEMMGEDKVSNRLDAIADGSRGKTNEALVEVAEEVKEDLEDTSPVDDGVYVDSWYIYEAKEDEVWILNSAEHAKFVMFPNSKMVGSNKADLPAQGILHNVEGIAKSHNKNLMQAISEKIQELFGENSE